MVVSLLQQYFLADVELLFPAEDQIMEPQSLGSELTAKSVVKLLDYFFQ